MGRCITEWVEMLKNSRNVSYWVEMYPNVTKWVELFV